MRAIVGFCLAACGGPAGETADEPSPEHRRLIEALDRRRPILPRLSGFDAWQPCPAAEALARRCGPPPAAGSEEFRRLGRLGADLRRAGGGRSPAELHVRALWQLLWSPEDNAARAAAMLDEVVLADPASSAARIDRVAAHIVAGMADSEPRELAAALEAAEKAAATAGAAGRFNHALALELFGLTAEAATIYRELAETPGPAGDWALEAAARAGRLELARARAVAQRLPGRELQLAMAEGLEEWAEAVLAGDPIRADRALARLGEAQERLTSISADRSLAEIGARLASAGPAARSLARGMRSDAEGLDDLREFDLASADEALERAAVALQAVPALAGWALYRRAVVAYQTGSAEGYRRALALLAAALERIGARPYPLLRGRIHYQGALVSGVIGDHMAALGSAGAARAALREGGDGAALTQVEELVAHEHRLLGQGGEAWRGAHAALRSAGATGTARGTYDALFGLTMLAREEGWHHAELAIADALVRSAGVLDRPAALAPALKERARARAALGLAGQARQDLDRAASVVAAMPVSAIRETLAADLRLATGDILLPVDPAGACRELDSAVRAYDASEYRLYLPAALRLRSRCRRSQGEHERASEDLEAAMRELERQRERIGEAGDRISFFDEARALFDERVELLAERGAWREALEAAERGRSRELLDRFMDGERPVSELGAIGDSLGRASAVLVYSFGSVEAYAWVLDGKGLWGRSLSASPSVIRSEVRRFREGIAAEASFDLTAARLERLHEMLIGPVLERLDGRSIWHVVLDDALHQLPFSALIDGDTKRHLFEDRVVVLAPSVSLLGVASVSLRQHRGGPPLVVAARAPSAGLPELEGAANEARRVAALRPGSRLLLDAPATLREAITAPWGHSVLHYAGHARASASDPLANGLILGDGELLSVAEIAEIAEIDASSLELVVLSACGTARGPVGASEGMRGLARAFIAAGAGSVVASLWDVNDETTADFVVGFYRQLATTGDPARALGRAKAGARRDGSPFATWGAFETYSARGPTDPGGTAQ